MGVVSGDPVENTWLVVSASPLARVSPAGPVTTQDVISFPSQEIVDATPARTRVGLALIVTSGFITVIVTFAAAPVPEAFEHLI